MNNKKTINKSQVKRYLATSCNIATLFVGVALVIVGFYELCVGEIMQALMRLGIGTLQLAMLYLQVKKREKNLLLRLDVKAYEKEVALLERRLKSELEFSLELRKTLNRVRREAAQEGEKAYKGKKRYVSPDDTDTTKPQNSPLT